jgi:hypothetical protein
VLRLLTITRLTDVFTVHACVDEAAGSTRQSELAAPALIHPALRVPS